ncbi:MAG: Crp/Fnr family transcriptional regulator [Bacteroidota bacterium]
MDKLYAQLDTYYPLPEPARSAFFSAWKPFFYEKGQFIVPEGRVSHYLGYVVKGVVRIFYVKHDREITEWLALDNSFFFSIRSFLERVPTHLRIHALEDCELRAIHHDDLMQLCDQYHAVEKLFRRMVSTSLLLSQVRLEALQFETAQQRYERLMRDRPDMLQRVPLGYIASFLGITQETLSRIRAKS